MSYIGNTPGVSSQRIVDTFIATAGQTTFTTSSGYTPGYVDVYYNGVKLVAGDDFTAATGSTIVLASGAALGDSIEIVAYLPRGLSDGYLKSEADARYVALTGAQTIAGVKTFSSQLVGIAGTAGAPAITTTGDLDTGIFFPAANTLAFSTNGTEDARFDASGNLLVGTSTTVSKATVFGTGNQFVSVISPTGSSTQVGINLNPSMTAAEAAANPAQAAIYAVDSNYSANIIFANKATGALGNALTERARIDSSGNLLVGRTSAEGTTPSKIQLVGSGNFTSTTVTRANTAGIYLTESSNTANYGTGIWFDHGSLMAGIASARAATNNWGTDLRFYTHPDTTSGVSETYERARIDSSGNLLVGTTTASAKVSINGGMFATGIGDLCIINSNDGISGAGFGLGVNRTNADGNAVYFWRAGSFKGAIVVSTGGTSYTTASDYRLKENVTPMTGALARVAALKPVTYKWKADGSDGEGFVAHELQEVVPTAVSGEKDATRIEQYEISPAVPATFDEEGNELTPAVEAVMGEREVPVYQGIDTSFLVATLTAAIQEQQAIIEQLKADVQALKEAA
jgi:hypothetical protein